MANADGAERAPLLIVDAANVVGSVPDGWWRDRGAAAVRLRDALADITANGLPSEGLPAPIELVMVVEGAARGVRSTPQVTVVSAHDSGDDHIVDLVRQWGQHRSCAVVTADRGLRDRVTALGAMVLGPRALPHLRGRPRR